jgi:hypothetical protein
MYGNYKIEKITLLMLLFLIFMSCKYDKNIIKNDTSLSETNKNCDNNLYKSICDYINSNRTRFIGNNLKGIEFYGLSNEQEEFYNKRLDFFMAILNNNEEIKSQYYSCAKKYYQKFPENVKYYYFWSKDVFDFSLFYLLKEQFGIIKLPMEIMNEYYMEIDIFIEKDK